MLTMPPEINYGSPRNSPNSRNYQLNRLLTDEPYTWSSGSKPTTDFRIQYIADYLIALDDVECFIITGNVISVSRRGSNTWATVDPLITQAIRKQMGWRSTPLLLWLRCFIEKVKFLLCWVHAKWLELTVAPVKMNHIPEFSPVTRTNPLGLWPTPPHEHWAKLNDRPAMSTPAA